MNRSLTSFLKCTATALLIGNSLCTPALATIITQWNFDAQNTTPSTGSGAASLLGTTATFATGIGGAGTFGWNLTNFPNQSSGSGTEGAEFDVPTTGAPGGTTSLLVALDLRTSNTASRWFRLDYTTDGTNWQAGTATLLGSGNNAGDTWHTPTPITIADPAALNNANFGVRILSVFNPNAFTQVSGNVNFAADAAYEVARNNGSSAYLGTGTWRLDNVTISAVPEPSTLGLAGFGVALAGLGVWKRRRTGSVVQVG
jgi:hypothetical protein